MRYLKKTPTGALCRRGAHCTRYSLLSRARVGRGVDRWTVCVSCDRLTQLQYLCPQAMRVLSFRLTPSIKTDQVQEEKREEQSPETQRERERARARDLSGVVSTELT